MLKKKIVVTLLYLTKCMVNVIEYLYEKVTSHLQFEPRTFRLPNKHSKQLST